LGQDRKTFARNEFFSFWTHTGPRPEGQAHRVALSSGSVDTGAGHLSIQNDSVR